MIHLSNKAKQYGLIALKVLILTATFLFIYRKVHTAGISFPQFLSEIPNDGDLWFILLFSGMAAANWFFEILKWRTVVASFTVISWANAARQCLMSLSVSLATPNRIGEYGAKALYFKPGKRKKVMVLNLFSNLAQLLATALFGIAGLLVFIKNYEVEITVWKFAACCGALLIVFISAYYFRTTELLIKGLSVAKIYAFIRNLPLSLRWKVIFFAIVRYGIFSSLFYLLLCFFGGTLPFWETIPLITAMYLLASVIPSFFIFDVAIKGGVALWLFSHTTIGEFPVLCTVLAMWLLNFGIPALIGSYFVARFKPIST
jgi:hypothetical protein